MKFSPETNHFIFLYENITDSVTNNSKISWIELKNT